MATTDVAVSEKAVEPERKSVVNDLSIQVATVNGSGSQSSNSVLLRAIFQMGIPVSGKNLFPSNIAGLPTWFTIRASKHGYIARRKEIDFLVAMNPETAEEDVRGLEPGAAVVYDEPLNLRRLRDDLIFYPVPFDKIVAPVCPDAKLRKLVRNMIYVGVVARLLAANRQAIGMVIGAGWAGARAMTSTAGPGISLMAEFVGLGYYAEVPAVIFDIQRVGPSTGLPTRTSQGDILSTAVLSHGDTKHILLFPSSVEECYTMAIEAFDLAEEFQTPVFVMSDLDLGMNNWMADAFPYPEKPIARGKVLGAEDLSRLGGFERYRDVDGDGICYRTLPGTRHPAAGYFARGSGPNTKAIYSERPEDYVNNLDRLNRKFETARARVPRPVIGEEDHHDLGIVAYGTSHWAVVEALDQLKQEHGLAVSYCRVRAYPFSDEVGDFIRQHRRVYVVEQNRDAQLCSLRRLELEAEQIKKLRSILHYNGLPIDARSVTDSIISEEAAVLSEEVER